MNEQDARARMVADITARLSENTALPRLMQIHKLLGYDAVQVDGDHPTHPVGADFRRDWEAGGRIKKMAKRYFVSERTICSWAESAGYPRRTSRKVCTIEPTPEFRAAWLGRVPTRKIARALGVSTTTVRRTAALAGLPRRSVGTPHDMFQGAAE